jgi:hypothetical protein
VATASGVDVDRVNYVNIALMLLSAVVAWRLPFELFLVSYAVLGPLHYLTQISWLHDRGYFTTGRWDWVPLGLLGVLALEAMYGHWLDWRGSPFVAFGLGLVVAFVQNPIVKVATLVACILLVEPMRAWFPARVFFGVLLTTVVHVYAFTGLFILAGSLKSRSRSGYASFAVFLACGLGLLLVRPPTPLALSAYARANLGPFESLVDAMTRIVPAGGNTESSIMAVGRFLGFAYTYHYLNWFSKTGVIRWHEIGAGRMATIGVLWAVSVALYWYDYETGLAALFFLSIVHVFLEFPLDARTFVDVVTARRRPAVVAVPARRHAVKS